MPGNIAGTALKVKGQLIFCLFPRKERPVARTVDVGVWCLSMADPPELVENVEISDIEAADGDGRRTHDGSDLRVDVHRGERTYVVRSRQVRPNLPATVCPFCPGGLEAPEEYDVHW